MNRLEFRLLAPDPDLSGLTALTESVGRENNVPSSIINDLNLALDEVVSNILTHGFGQGSGTEIVVRLNVEPDQISADIDDNAPPFDPLTAPPPDLGTPLQERQVGGLGVHFVKALMDTVSYERVENLNRLHIAKRF